jgi:hypothetical protein
MVTTRGGFFAGAGILAGSEGAARGAKRRREKAKNDQQGTEARQNAVVAGAHMFIVLGVGREGNHPGQWEHGLGGGNSSTMQSWES